MSKTNMSQQIIVRLVGFSKSRGTPYWLTATQYKVLNLRVLDSVEGDVFLLYKFS